jgi:hypothetical protein
LARPTIKFFDFLELVSPDFPAIGTNETLS